MSGRTYELLWVAEDPVCVYASLSMRLIPKA